MNEIIVLKDNYGHVTFIMESWQVAILLLYNDYQDYETTYMVCRVKQIHG